MKLQHSRGVWGEDSLVSSLVGLWPLLLFVTRHNNKSIHFTSLVSLELSIFGMLFLTSWYNITKMVILATAIPYFKMLKNTIRANEGKNQKYCSFYVFCLLSIICYMLLVFFDAEYLPKKYQTQKQAPFLFDKLKYSEYIGGFTKEQIHLRKYIHG